MKEEDEVKKVEEKEDDCDMRDAGAAMALMPTNNADRKRRMEE